MPEVAQATITVTPVLEGAQQTLTEELTSAATPAGTSAGTAAGRSMSTSMGKTMTGAGKALTGAVTVPIMAIGAAAVSSWKEVDAGMDTIVQKTGASGAELDNMRQVLSNVATSIPTDFATAGAAIGEVSTRFGVVGDDLEDLSGQFIKFAKLNDQDVSSSVDSVSKMMAAMGVETKDAGRMLDALNVVGQKTGVDVGYLADTVATNAAQFKQMGLSVEDSAMLLGDMSMAGLDSSTAMMGLKTAMKNATEDGVSMSDALSGFMGVMNSNATESDKLAAAYELFGTRAGAAIYNAVSNGTLDLSNFTGSLEDFEGSVDETFTNTQSPAENFTTVINQLKDAGAQLVEAFGPTLTSVLGSVADVVERLTAAWSGLSPETQEIIVKTLLVAAVLGPVLMIGGSLVGVVSKLAGGLGGLIGKIGGIGGAAGEAAGPIATAGGSFASMAGSALQLVAAGVMLALAAWGISMVADAAIDLASAGGPAIATFFGMVGAIALLMAVASALGPALTAGAVGIAVFGGVVVGIGFGVRLAAEGISTLLDAVGRLTDTISQNAPQISEIISAMGEAVGGVITDLSDGIATVIDAISGGISGILDSVAGIVESFGNAALNAGTGFDMLSTAVTNLVNNTGVLDLAATLGAVAGGVKDINKAAKDSDDSATKVNTLAEAFPTLVDNVNSAKSAITDFKSTAMSSFNSVSASFSAMNLGGQMSSMMSSAYSSASSSLDSLKSLFSRTELSFNQNIKLPHFVMVGKFDAETRSVPKVNVSWWAKAAEYGALFTKPQIIGVGDASQPELLIGEEKLRELVKGNSSNVWNVTVNGAESPELWAKRFVRQAKMQERIS